MSQRTDRLDSQIRQELADLLHREMKDPRIGFATITRVETARDLGTAKVWVSIMGTDDEREETMKALTDAAPWLRRQLGGRLTLRHIPQLAIRHSLERLNTTEVRINILREGAGDINESDINLASASDAVVIGFNTKLDPGAQRSVDATGVDVRIYDVIYKLVDDIGLALSGLLTPKLVEQVEGHAEVRMVIKAGRAGNVAGSYVTDGRIVRGGQVRLLRAGQLLTETRITSLKRFKDDVREVATGFECGIGLDADDIVEGDVIECYQMVTEQA